MGGFDWGVEADVFVELVLVRDFNEVVEDFFLAWVLARPVWVWFEGEGVRWLQISCE